MIIVDTALEERQKNGNPINVGIIGAGYMGRGIVLQIETAFKGMRAVAVYNRTISQAERAYKQAEITDFVRTESVDTLDEAVSEGKYVITDNPDCICESKNIDAIIEATGEIDFGAKVVLKAIENRKHVILMNAELDATIGPLLKQYADKAGVVITNADGDQPGVIMNLFRFVKQIGYQPVLAGNIKGMQDPYRNPDTQRAFAEKYKQKTRMVTSFADGTKISMEMAVVANATGFKTARRGMFGPQCKNVTEAVDLFPKGSLLNGGIVDYILGAEPGPGVFVLGYNDHPIKREYMPVFKMGDGPFYTFYIPYHLPHLEVPITAARAVLFNDAAITPIGSPVCDVITIAKRDVKAGEVLDGIGGFTCFGTLENSDIVEKEKLLPMGLSEGCKLVRDLPKDSPITYDDVKLPEGRLSDRLREEQYSFFNSNVKI